MLAQGLRQLQHILRRRLPEDLTRLPVDDPHHGPLGVPIQGEGQIAALVSRSRAKVRSLPSPNSSEALMPLTLRISSRFSTNHLGLAVSGTAGRACPGLLTGAISIKATPGERRLPHDLIGCPGANLRSWTKAACPPADRLSGTAQLESHLIATGNRRVVQ